MGQVTERAERLNLLSGGILDAAIEVHRELGGPGLLESIYEESFAHELGHRGLQVERQVAVPVQYKGRLIKSPLVIDLLVEDSVIVEVKSVEKFNTLFASQLLTYLRLTGRPLGIILNFGEKYVKNGFHRVVNQFPSF